MGDYVDRGYYSVETATVSVCLLLVQFFFFPQPSNHYSKSSSRTTTLGSSLVWRMQLKKKGVSFCQLGGQAYPPWTQKDPPWSMWYHYIPVSLPFMFIGVFSGTFCWQTHSPIRIMGVGCFAVKTLYDILVYTNCWEMMMSVGIDGSSSLLFMMYVMVWHFLSNSHKIMTTLMVV
jgi:hypothetical protein